MKTSALIDKLRPYLPRGYQNTLRERLQPKYSLWQINRCCNDAYDSEEIQEAILQLAAENKKVEQEKARSKKALERRANKITS